MARSVARILASAAVLSLSTAAFAADLLPAPPQLQPLPQSDAPDTSGWYLRGDVGVGANINDIGLKNTPDPLPGSYSTAATEGFYNTSVSASAEFDVGVGYQFNRWLRGDVTLEYRGGSQLQSMYVLTDPGAYQLTDTVRGNLSSIITMANVYADIGTWNGITPFVGGGLGMAHNMVSGMLDQGYSYSATDGLGNGGGYFKNSASNSLAWALMAGVDFNITHSLKLELGYRYLNYGTVKSGASNCLAGLAASSSIFSAANCGGSASYISSSNRLASNDFRLGLIWTLDGDQPAPPPQQVLIRKY